MNKKFRYEGIDLLRIISMLMVVVLHILGIGGVIENTVENTSNYYISNFMEHFCFCAVNLYALITGFVYIKATYRFHKIVSLWCEVFFYSFLITIIFLLLPGFNISKINIIYGLIPITSSRYWYFTSYFCLFLLIPFLNKAINNMSQLLHKRIVFIGFILFGVISLIGSFVGCYDIFKLEDGYSAIWLMYLYIVGAYIKLYYRRNLYKKKVYFIIYLCSVFANFFFDMCVIYVKKHVYSKLPNVTLQIYNSPFIIIASIALFLLFVDLHFSKGKSIINIFSSVSFSVYLISVHPVLFYEFQKSIFNSYASMSSGLLVLSVVISAVAIYIVCSLIGYIQKQLFKLIKIDLLSQKIVNIGKRLLNKVHI